MRIVSQDKMTSLPINYVSISIDHTNKNSIIVYSITDTCDNDAYFEYGEYETEDRAKEVFLEIMNAYASNENAAITPAFYDKCPVYYMPER